MQHSDISLGLKAAAALDACGFQNKHSLGQNFILDERFLSHLLDLTSVDENDNVLEIGPGPGLMTALLSERANRVFAVEADDNLRPVLDRMVGDCKNCKVTFADALKSDLETIVGEFFCREEYRVIANLPYYITADLIQKMIVTQYQPESICVMVQKEAADRLMSEPGDKNWGAFAAIVRYYGDTVVLEDVPASVFNPPPHVQSCFIRISVRKDRELNRIEEKAFIRFIKACFTMRRKTLANNLKASYGLSQTEATEIITGAGFDAQIRGETLQIEELLIIFDTLNKRLASIR